MVHPLDRDLPAPSEKISVELGVDCCRNNPGLKEWFTLELTLI